jgi:hypothetical protein
MDARRSAVVAAFALLLTGGPLVMSTPGSSPPAAAEDGSSPSVFVNEIHYANAGVDAGEFVEIAGPSGTDLSGYDVVLYDGATGDPYESTALTQPLAANGTLVVDYPVEGIQDGPDAVAVVDAGQVVDFVSYGGEVTATGGPAEGQTSLDAGVTESDDTSAEKSIQVVGTGGDAGAFTWSGPKDGSRGAPNDGQTLTTLDVGPEDLPSLAVDEEPGAEVTHLVPPSDPANEVLIEGESMVPTAVGTPVISQESSGALVWSGDHQLRVNAVELYDSSTMTFELPVAGRWDSSVDMTTGPNFGLAEIKIDGQVVGTFEGRVGTQNALVRRYPLGQHDLAAGTHTITLTAIGGRNNQFRVGLDLMRWRLQPPDGRLTLTPWRADAIRGEVPVFGWSTDMADDLTIQVDHGDVSDWDATAESATLVYRGFGIDAGPPGARFRDGIRARGLETIIDYNVNATNGALDGIQISGERLLPGENAIDIFAGADPAFGTNKDDFSVQNVWLVLADGTVLKDPARPDGTRYFLGDDEPGAAAERTWTFTIPPGAEPHPAYHPARGYLLDTSGLSDGDHVVTLVAEGPAGTEKLHHHVTVDNGAPMVSGLTPANGERVKGSFVLDATVTDAGDLRPTVDARLDGTPVSLGDAVNTDDLVDGPHTFSVVVTDAAGNYDDESTTFTTVGETPGAPQLVRPLDGSPVPGTQADLGVVATDPAGEQLHVDFLQATQSGPPVAGRAGTTDGDVPAPAAGQGTLVDAAAVATSDDTYVDSEPTGDTPYQRYDVKVSKVRGAKYVDLSWEGRVAADRDAVLSVWDVGLQAWKEVVSARGSDTNDTTLVGTTRLGPAIDGDVVHVLIEARDPFAAIPSTPDHAFANPDDYDLALAWMTDTQYLSQGAVFGGPTKDVFAGTYQAINDWIVANTAPRKIVYSAHTGDIINSWQSTATDEARARAEYAFAGKTMKILDDGLMPNGVLAGNHDNKTGSDNTLFNEYFGPSRYEALEAVAPKGDDGEGFYGGPWQPGDNQNHYDLIEAGGVKLILLHFSYLVKDDEIAWANQVLAEHRDRAAVLLTHSYLLPSRAPDAMGSELTTQDGRDLFDKVVVPNHNVFLTLSGHVHGMGLNIKHDVGVKGRTVVEMVANTQFFEINGVRRLGYLRLLQLNAARGELTVDTYSPYAGDFDTVEYDTQAGRDYTESADEFVVPVDLPTRTTSLRTDAVGLAIRGTTVIGSADVASGDTASVTWKNLTAGTRYSWYARATDPTGASAESSVFSFVTAAAKQ